MSKKAFYSIWVCLCVCILSLRAQHKELAVDLIAQRADKLCWAASMDMVMGYQLPGVMIDQCVLVDKLLSIYTPGTGSPCASFCPDCDPVDLAASSCNTAILFTSNPLPPPTVDEMAIDYDQANIDLLFTQNGFFSMEDHMRLDWQQYKNEIDLCRPVMLLYNVIGIDDVKGARSFFNHVVVGKGYTTMTGFSAGTASTDEYFMVNDPWQVCDGESYLLHNSALNGSVTPVTGGSKVIQVNGFLSMVHHISPKSAGCDPCQMMPDTAKYILPEENRLLAMLQQSGKDFLATSQGSIFKEDQLQEYEANEHYTTPVYYLSYAYFDADPSGAELNFNAAIVKTDVREVTYTGSEIPLYSRIRCDKEIGACTVETIGLETKDPSRSVLIGDRKIILSNDPKIQGNDNVPVVQYSIVRFPSYTFEFYRFVYNGAVYYYPIDSTAKLYFYGAEFLDSQAAIPERLILQGLVIYVQDYEEPKLVEKGDKFRERLQTIMQGAGFLKMRKFLKLQKN